MADTARILVRRQVVEVELHGTEADGIALQRRLPETCSRVLAPTLEAALASADPGDPHVYVERLEVDVGRISLSGLDDELAAALRAAIEEFLRSNLPAPAAGDVPGALAASRPASNAPGAPGGLPAAGEVRRRTARETVDEALLVFLSTGRLPWAFQLPPAEQFEAVVLRAWSAAGVSRGPPGQASRTRLLGVLAEPSARARLLMQFSPQFATIVLRRLAPDSVATVEACLGALGAVEQSSSSVYRSFVRRLWHAVLAAVADDCRLDPRQLVGEAWRTLPAADRGSRALDSALDRRWPGVTRPRLGVDNAAARADHVMPSEPGADSARVVRPVASPVHPSPDSSIPAAVDEDTDGLIVDNAGLVLLHPFLPRFFQALGVAEGDRLVDPGRALCLLHHLSTGELIAPEHELTLAKVLCNVPLDDPVEADVGITPAETEEAVALLEAAIRHWETLRNTSPDALRGEFLMRTGQLSMDAEDGWLLRVEARTVDILLDQLPWAVTLIKLPWMHRMLRVEWR